MVLLLLSPFLYLADGLPLSFFSEPSFLSCSVQMVGAWQPPTASKPTSYHANHKRDWPSASLCWDSLLLQIGPRLKQLWVRGFPPVWSNVAKEWGPSVQSGASCCWPLTPVDSYSKVMSKWKTLQREPRTWSEFPAILHTGMTERDSPPDLPFLWGQHLSYKASATSLSETSTSWDSGRGGFGHCSNCGQPSSKTVLSCKLKLSPH